MSFLDLDIKLSYISCGEDNIAKSFLVPALKKARLYRRSVGFFSSSVFEPIIDGIVALSRNGGKIELIEQNLKNALNLLEQEDLFIEYFNERKLIRKLKKEQLEKRKDK